MNLSAGNLIAGLLFSGIGFVAFTYGKRQGRFRLMALGGVLMAYSYFTPTEWTWILGAAMTAALYLFRDWLNEA